MGGRRAIEGDNPDPQANNMKL